MFSQKGEKIALTPEHAIILSNKEIGKREQLLYKQIIWAKQGGGDIDNMTIIKGQVRVKITVILSPVWHYGVFKVLRCWDTGIRLGA